LALLQIVNHATHFFSKIDNYLEQGWSKAEKEEQARKKFGSVHFINNIPICFEFFFGYSILIKIKPETGSTI